jgi:hypothetical protein
MDILYSSCKEGNLIKLKLICDKLKTIKRQNTTNNNSFATNNEFLYKPDSNGYNPFDLTVIHNNFECCIYLFETYNLNPLDLNQVGNSAFSYSIGKLIFFCF